MGHGPTGNGFADSIRTGAFWLADRGYRVVLNHTLVADGRCTCGKLSGCSTAKHPRGGEGWQARATADRDALTALLDAHPVSNIGVLLDGLVDVDFDHTEAARAARVLMPATGLVLGRESAPASHWFYRCRVADSDKGHDFADPVMVSAGNEQRANLAEFRVDGQTVVAPSVHKTQEAYRWERDSDPAEVTAADLLVAVKKTAAAALLGKYLPSGKQHKASLALAGWLCRNGWSKADVMAFVKAVAVAGKHDDVNDRVKAAADTCDTWAKILKGESDEQLTGLPKLVEKLGDAVADHVVGAVAKWLGVSTRATGGPKPNWGTGANGAAGGGGAGNTRPPEWGDPVPLTHRPAVPTYPADILPDWLGEWAAAVATELQVPIDLPAALGLGIVGAGLARKVVVSPRKGFREPVNLYVMPALPPGDRKTQTFRHAIAPVQELQTELRREMEPVITEKESDKRVADLRVKKLETDLAKEDDPTEQVTIKAKLETARKEAAAIKVPPVPILYVEDDTPASLKRELIRQGGRVMVATTEAKALENITAWSDEADFDVYLKGHAGDELNTGRIGRDREGIDKPALSCVLAPQPEVLRGLAQHKVLRGRGFLARWLYALPRSIVGYRRIAAPAVPDEVRDRYHANVRRAWAVDAPLDEFNNPTEYVLKFGPEAAAAFQAFEAEVEPLLREGAILEPLAGWGNKLTGECVRLAAVIHVADAVGAGEDWNRPIGEAAVRRAVRLCRDYLIPHAIAAFDLMGADPRVAVARKVWGWVVAGRLSVFTAREAFRAVRCASIETMDDLQPGLDLLERHFLIRPKAQDGGPRGRGRPGSPMYEVNPRGPDDADAPPDRGPEPPSPPSDETTPHGQKSQKAQKSAADPQQTNSVNSVSSVRGGAVPAATVPAPPCAGQPEADPPSVQQPTPTHIDLMKLLNNSGDASRKPAVSPPAEPGAPPADFTLVTTAAGLSDVVAAVEDAGAAAIDTETTGLDPRTSTVRLLQVATPGATFVIDLFRIDTPADALAELFEVLARVTVVGHNLAFDLGFLARLGFTPGAAFDTMLAATVLSTSTEERSFDRRGFDLAAVAEWMLGRTVAKEEQLSDWSRPDLSPAQLAYAAADAAVLLPLADRLREEINKSEDTAATVALEMRALLCAAWAEPVKVDGAAWLAIADEAAAQAKQLAEQMNELVPKPGGLFDEGWNWNSPDQAKAAFAVLGLTLENTDDDALAAIKKGKGKQLADLLRQHRAAVKLAGTYGRKWVEDHVVAGGVRPRWNQIGAGSGRMSCSKPNLQQIPRDVRYRKCFVAGPGNVLVKADYSQIELRVAAKIAGEKVMLAAYSEGRDLHTLTAARLIGKPEAEVKKGDRQLAKAVNFGLLYGMGAESLRTYADANYGVKLTAAEATSHRDTFFATYPGLKLWHNRIRELLKKQDRDKTPHVTRTRAGRLAVLPATKSKADGSSYPNLNEASNFPVQGTAADGLKAAMALLWERRAEMPGAVPVLFVHDEIVLEVPEANGEKAAAWLKGIMVEGMAPLIDPVPAEVEVAVGKTWGGD